MRIERFGNVTLHLGDCMEVLPQVGQVDGVISDPPYGIKYVGGKIASNSISRTKRHHNVAIHGDDKPFDPSPFLPLGVCCFTGAQHFAERLPGGSFHVWNKRGPYAPIDQADGDLIWVSGEKKALRIVDLLWRGLCRHVERDSQIEHPTQKPVGLMKWCIEKAGYPQRILDPYMGSGSTGVAAMEMGLSFVGIEIDATYFDVACRRIEQAYKQRSLFVAIPAAPAASKGDAA